MKARRKYRYETIRAFALVTVGIAFACNPSVSVPNISISSGSAKGPVAAEGCRSLAAAQKSVEEGRLRTAERLLMDCHDSADANGLLTRVRADLGDTTVSPSVGSDIAETKRKQQARQPASSASTLSAELEGIRTQLLAGNCQQASETAVASYWGHRPNAEAAILAGRAAACLKLGPESNRWFARASWELETGGELRWTIERFSGGGSWNADDNLELGVYGSGLKYRAIGSSAPIEDWRFGMVRLPNAPQPGTLLYANDRIRTYSGSNGLVFGVDNVTGKRLWQVDPAPDAYAQVKTGLGLGEGTIVQIRRQPTGFAGLWRQIDAILGKATEWKLLSGVHLEGVSLDFSSPHANWLVLSSLDAKGWETIYYVVSGTGKVKPWHEKEWLQEPLGVWAKDELIYAVNNSLVAVNVWNLRRRVIAPLPPELGRVHRLVRGDAGRIYLEGEHQIAEFDCNAGRCGGEARLLAPPLDLVKDSNWSPHGQFLSGRLGGLDECASTWSLRKNSLVFRQPVFIESTRVAVSPDEDSIALSSARESAEIDLRSGALRFGAPLPSTLPNLIPAQTSTVHAISADGNFAVMSKEGTGEVIVARLSPNEPRLVPLLRQSAKSLKTVRALFEKSSQTAFVKVDGDWFAVALPSGEAKPVLESIWLEDAVEFSGDGSFVLTPTGVTTGRGAKTRVVPFVPTPNELASEFIGEAKLAFHGKLALFPTKEGLLVWSTTNGKWLGQLKQVVQGLVFTQDRPGEQGRGLVEVFGETARESLLCSEGERLYPWAVCSDRFEAPGLLRETLLGNSQSP